MKREKILKIVWPFLIGILVLVWVQALKSAGPQRSSDQSRDIAVIAGSGGGAPVFVTPEMSGQSKKSSYPDWGRNPFVVSSAVSQEFILGGILWDVNKPAAIINGEVVAKGDSVGSYVVVEVQPDRVILNDGEKDIELRLEKEE
jgi:hypothetical protein